MECKFTVGQKVTPVKVELTDYQRTNSSLAKRAGVFFPKYGEIYTVREICICKLSNGEEIVTIKLFEIRNDPHMRFANGKVCEIGFYAKCFRPVSERKTDISIFTSMLTGDKVSA